MTYSIKITDADNNLIGSLPAATIDQVRKFLRKGLVVIEHDLDATVGVSECVI